MFDSSAMLKGKSSGAFSFYGGVAAHRSSANELRSTTKLPRSMEVSRSARDERRIEPKVLPTN
jgi:hypothetical protein